MVDFRDNPWLGETLHTARENGVTVPQAADEQAAKLRSVLTSTRAIQRSKQLSR
jgi:hypothetical protein